MVQDKRVLEPETGVTYPYGYAPTEDLWNAMRFVEEVNEFQGRPSH